MLVRTNNKEEAFRALINGWLKDQTLYCNNCLEFYKQDVVCCENPHVGRNMDHCKGVIDQNKMLRETRANDFASTKDKSMRWGISMPPDLLRIMDKYKKSLDQPGLFKEPGEIEWFARKFPQFAVCKRV